MEWLGSEAVLNAKPPVKQRFDPDPNNPGTGTFVYKAAALHDVKPPTDLALILGDALTNYRATLDYIAWQFAVAPAPSGQGRWADSDVDPHANDHLSHSSPRWASSAAVAGRGRVSTRDSLTGIHVGFSSAWSPGS